MLLIEVLRSEATNHETGILLCGRPAYFPQEEMVLQLWG